MKDKFNIDISAPDSYNLNGDISNIQETCTNVCFPDSYKSIEDTAVQYEKIINEIPGGINKVRKKVIRGVLKGDDGI